MGVIVRKMVKTHNNEELCQSVLIKCHFVPHSLPNRLFFAVPQ